MNNQTSENLLDIAIQLALLDNKVAFAKLLLENPYVFFLRPNLWARLDRRSWPGKIKITLIDTGLSVWTLKEAIE